MTQAFDALEAGRMEPATFAAMLEAERDVIEQHLAQLDRSQGGLALDDAYAALELVEHSLSWAGSYAEQRRAEPDEA